jgi:predicted PhzF superfamily epimerase YddE/YHI9
VQIDKQAVLDLLREKGQQDQASQAEQQLPDQVDTDKNADLLQRLGIDPREILEKFMGRGGIPSL